MQFRLKEIGIIAFPRDRSILRNIIIWNSEGFSEDDFKANPFLIFGTSIAHQ